MKNSLKKMSLIFMFIFTVAITTHITYAETESSQNEDTPSEWAQEDIDKAEELDLLPRKLQREFSSNITREEFSELAVNLFEALSGVVVSEPEENPFNDTENEKVLIANNLGIVNGKGDGKFDPENTVTREEISVMLYRTLQAAKPEYKFSDTNGYIFLDDSVISSWAKEAVHYLYSVEVINGVSNNRFNPSGDTSREEAIVLTKRMYDRVIASEKADLNNLVVSRSIVDRQKDILKAKLATLIPLELGKPYQWGGIGPNSYDCSGLVYSMFGKLGISLPRTSKTQAGAGTYVAKEDLVYGDLVFFARDGRNINHVGIYVGNGEFFHSPESGDVVKISTLMTGYYSRSYYTARRVLP